MELYAAIDPTTERERIVYIVEENPDLSHVQTVDLMSGWFYPTKRLKPVWNINNARLIRLIEQYRVRPADYRLQTEHIENFHAILKFLIESDFYTEQDIWGETK